MDVEAIDSGSQCLNCGDKIDSLYVPNNSLKDYVRLDILCDKCLLIFFGQNVKLKDHIQGLTLCSGK